MGDKAKKMYNKEKAPKLDRDEKGAVTVKEGKKPTDAEKTSDTVQSGTEGVVREGSERTEMTHRHIKEKLDMHARHETEHAQGEDKSAMYTRHMDEMKDMNGRHEKEMKSMQGRHGKDTATEGGKEDTHGAKGGVEKPKEEHKAKPDKSGEKE